MTTRTNETLDDGRVTFREAWTLDPVCGAAIDTAHDAVQFQHEGTTHYFCSEECKRRFEENPREFAAGP